MKRITYLDLRKRLETITKAIGSFAEANDMTELEEVYADLSDALDKLNSICIKCGYVHKDTNEEIDINSQ